MESKKCLEIAELLVVALDKGPSTRGACTPCGRNSRITRRPFAVTISLSRAPKAAKR